MTEKRFKMKKLEYEVYFIDSQQEYVDKDEPNFKIDGEKTMSDSQILDLLNENEQLKSKNRGLQSELQIFREDGTYSNQIINKLDGVIGQLRARVDYLENKIQRERNSHIKQHEKWEEEIQKENEELKQRNDRQAKQLDRLYNLIEEKDWRTLTDILDDFKRCEEQLQKEWGTYGDVE